MLVHAILHEEVDYSALDAGLAGLLRRMLTREPSERATVVDLLFDEWVTEEEGAIELYQALADGEDSFFNDS